MAAVGAVCWWMGLSPVGAEPEAPLPPAFSPVIEAEGVLYVSGHLPLRPNTRTLDGNDIGTQTRRVLQNVAETLRRAQSGLDEVVRVTVYLTSMDNFADFNAAYASHFSRPWPARTTVAVKELAFGARIEVSCIAVRGHARRPPSND
ncbi:MAG: RidA family protein [Phycisphaerae bacterium]